MLHYSGKGREGKEGNVRLYTPCKMIATPFSNLMMSVIQIVVLHNSGENSAHYAPVLLYMYMYTVLSYLPNPGAAK